MYHQGIQNGNADALSRHMEIPSEVPSAPTVILQDCSVEQMKLAKKQDPIIKQFQRVEKSPECLCSRKWYHLPLHHY